MKKFLLLSYFVFTAVLITGCNESEDKRVNMTHGVKSDTAVNNWVTRPFYGVYSLLAGEGIDIKDVKTRTNETGFLEIQVTGFNRAIYDKRFDYKIDWLDKNNVVVDAKSSVWITVSAKSRTTFSYKAVSPSKEAVDFRMNTRKTPE